MNPNNFTSIDRLVYKVKKAGRDLAQIEQEFVSHDDENPDPVPDSWKLARDLREVF